MADPRHFDADPDPTYPADADPEPDPKFCLAREKKFYFPNLQLFFLHNLTKLVMCNFLSNFAGRGAKGEG